MCITVTFLNSVQFYYQKLHSTALLYHYKKDFQIRICYNSAACLKAGQICKMKALNSAHPRVLEKYSRC